MVACVQRRRHRAVDRHRAAGAVIEPRGDLPMKVHEEVPEALAGERIDRVMAMLTGRSRAEVAGLIEAGIVLVGGSPATSRSTRVRVGDAVEAAGPGGGVGGDRTE